MTDVDFVVNCYEKTYREVLEPGHARWLASQSRFEFARLSILVNNVDDCDDAKRRSERLLRSGTVDGVEFVSDHVNEALEKCGLKPTAINRLPHFSDCCLVAVTRPGPEWILYWDADARLDSAHDWVSPTLELMSSRTEIAVGNPQSWHAGIAEAEAVETFGSFAVGYGFSDVVFLVRRPDLAAPIYNLYAPASWRFPLAHVEAIFEQRVDSWMRRRRRLRATYLPASYTHRGDAGGNYPSRTTGSRMRRVGLDVSRGLLSRLSAHPAVRAYG